MADENEFILRDTTGDPDRIEGQPTEAGDPVGVDDQPPEPNDNPGVERTSTRNEDQQDDLPTSPINPPRTARQIAEARKAKQRQVMFRILVADYSRSETEEEAEEMAEEMVDFFVKKKPEHTEAMGHLCLKVKAALFRVNRAQEVIGDLEGDLLELRKAKTEATVISRTRRHNEYARGLLRDWGSVERDLRDAADMTAKTYYRPILEDEPGARKVLEVKVLFEQTLARLNAAEQELEELLAPPAVVQAPAAATPVAPEEKKIFARDFVVSNYVSKKFSGDDEGSAIRDFHGWRKQWAHAEQRIAETCKEADDAAMLHLLGKALEGSALNLISSSLNHQAALAILEDKYHNIVALVESYDVHSKEAKGPEHQANEILANIDRWPHLEDLLNEVGIDLRTYYLIHSQLALLDTNAGNKNPSIRWTGHVKALMRDKPENTDLGEVYNLNVFKKWVHRVRDDAVTAAAQGGEDISSARLFAVAADAQKTVEKPQGCLVCGPEASHRSPACSKVEKLSDDDYFRLAKEKGWCAKCLRHPYTPTHAKLCPQRCEKCQGLHLTCRHRAGSAAGEKRNGDSQDQPRDRPVKKRKAEASREQRESAPSTSKDFTKDPGFQAALEKALDEREARNRAKSAPSYARGNSRGRGKGREGKNKDGPKRDTSKTKIKKEKK